MFSFTSLFLALAASTHPTDADIHQAADPFELLTVATVQQLVVVESVVGKDSEGGHEGDDAKARPALSPGFGGDAAAWQVGALAALNALADP